MQDSTGTVFHPFIEGLRILLVDDSDDNQRLLSMILKKAGADVTQARNGQEGIYAVKMSQNDGKPFDVILMDIRMPVMDGFTASKTLRDQGIQTPIIALTGNTGGDVQDQCYAAGFTDFLTKPILRYAFLNAIAKNIDTQTKEIS